MSVGLSGNDDGTSPPAGSDGIGVLGTSDQGRGVVGTSKARPGVEGDSDFVGVWGDSKGNAGVLGVSHAATFPGVSGINDQAGPDGIGVAGACDQGRGVVGTSKARPGVEGDSDFVGVWGDSKGNAGVLGVSHAATFPGVSGINDQAGPDGIGVAGACDQGRGVVGTSKARPGVEGDSDFVGVWGDSKGNAGVFGISHSPTFAGVAGTNDKGGPAGFFDGNVIVSGDIQLSGADYAEDFDAAAGETVEPGTVMVLDANGAIRTSDGPYDCRVAGVIPGAGGFRSAVILDRREGAPSRLPLALMGKVFCKVDATESSVRVGDLLTTSPTPGHAMRATDPHRAFGAVIGKALGPLDNGIGLVPILVSLR